MSSRMRGGRDVFAYERREDCRPIQYVTNCKRFRVIGSAEFRIIGSAANSEPIQLYSPFSLPRPHAHTGTRARAHTHTHTHAYTHARTHARTQAHIRTHTHTHAHAHAHAHAHIRTLSLSHTHLFAQRVGAGHQARRRGVDVEPGLRPARYKNDHKPYRIKYNGL
jgi:hypothetical protein